MHHILEFNQSQWLKPYIEFNTQKGIEVEKNGHKDGKALYKFRNNTISRKTMENQKQNRCKTRKQQKRLFKMYTKTKVYIAQYI